MTVEHVDDVDKAGFRRRVLRLKRTARGSVTFGLCGSDQARQPCGASGGDGGAKLGGRFLPSSFRSIQPGAP